ncbi:hypothetical protein DOY81_009133 [Sarcophaga bullata]|nr:hypothetical protein DOY81_009133 [Sarcophaga bullata]
MLPPKIWIICRVCLKQQDKLYNIFENSFLTNIWYILRDCGGVPVRRNDNFPDKICERCLKRLWEVYEFRIDCQRAHRDMVQKQLNWRADISDLELKNQMGNCTESSTVSDSTKVSSSSRSDNSSSSSTTNESSNASTLKQSIKLKHNSMNSQTSSISNKKIIIRSKSLNLNEIVNEFKGFTNNDEIKIPRAEEEIHNPIMKQYCVVTKKDVDEQTERHEQKNIEEPIVLRLKVKNKQSNENIPTIGYDLMKANNNNETTNQIANTKVSNEINMNANIKTDLSSNKSSESSSSNEAKRNDCKLRCKKCKKKCKTFIDLRHHMYTHIKPHHCNICQRKFSQSHALLSHANNHTGIKPFYAVSVLNRLQTYQIVMVMKGRQHKHFQSVL